MKNAPILLFLLLFNIGCASSQHTNHRPVDLAGFVQGLNAIHQQGIQQHRDTVRFHERNNAQKIQIQNTGYGRLPANQNTQVCDLRCQHARQIMLRKLYFGQ